MSLVVCSSLDVGLHSRVSGPEFTYALRNNCRDLLRVYKLFISETHAQLWDPKKFGKDKWQQTQIDLVMVVAILCRSLNSVQDKAPKAASGTSMIDRPAAPNTAAVQPVVASSALAPSAAARPTTASDTAAVQLWDSRGSIMLWSLEERYALFQWY